MTQKIRILFLSANPWTTSRILVDEEAREVFERIQEGPYRDRFELHKHTATRPIDLQRLLLLHRPHIVHFSGHGSKQQKIILGGTPGRGRTVDRQGLAEVFALYNSHLRLVLLNACFTRTQSQSIARVIDYSIGTGKGIGDKAGVAFAGAFYRALGFGNSVRAAFESAKAELGLTKIPRTRGFELFARDGLKEDDAFPQTELSLDKPQRNLPPLVPHKQLASEFMDGELVSETMEERTESRITILETSITRQTTKWIRSKVFLQVSNKVGLQT